MRCKKWRLVSWLVTAVGALFFLGSYLGRWSWDAFSITGVVLMLLGIGIHAAKFRCPACRRHISDRSPWGITHCPFCGAALEDKEARK